MARSLDVIDVCSPAPSAANEGAEGDSRRLRALSRHAGRTGWRAILFLILALLAGAAAAGCSERALATDAEPAFRTIAAEAGSRADHPSSGQTTDGAPRWAARLQAGAAQPTAESPRRKLRAASKAPAEALVAADRFTAGAAARPRPAIRLWKGPLERERPSPIFMSQGPPRGQKIINSFSTSSIKLTNEQCHVVW